MKEYIKTIFFLLFTSPLWALTIIEISALAQHYPDIIDALPLVRVEYDSLSGRYLLGGSYELVYPTILLSLLTLLFLWRVKPLVREFVAFALTVPVMTITVSMIIGTVPSSPSTYRAVISYSIGAILYYLLSKGKR